VNSQAGTPALHTVTLVLSRWERGVVLMSPLRDWRNWKGAFSINISSLRDWPEARQSSLDRRIDHFIPTGLAGVF
jgi:hypothetical protein